MEQAAEDAPAWGTLPVEQYILGKWDPDSPLPVDEQRNMLLKAFIQEDALGVNPDPASSLQAGEVENLVRTVLVPWRRQGLRRIAGKYAAHSGQLGGELVVLRTHYRGGVADDAKLQGWLEEADPFDECLGGPDDRSWRVLEDAALFDLGEEEWEAVYNVLPELASPRPRRGFSDEDVSAVRELVLAKGEGRELDEDDYEEAILSQAATASCILLIADEQAFEDDEFGLVFRDKKGNIVKQSTIPPSEVQSLLQYASRGALFESEYWLDASVGKKYKTRGEIMRALLPIVMTGAE